jgi:2-methylcitrate dehydratase
VQVFFTDGSATPRIQVDFPVGHRRRRREGEPLMAAKFEAAVSAHYPARQAARVLALFGDPARLTGLSVNEFMAELVSNGR